MTREFLNRPHDRWGFIRARNCPTENLAIFVHGFRGGYLDTWGKLADSLVRWSDDHEILRKWDYLFVGYDTAAVRSYIDIAQVVLTQWRGACKALPPFDRRYSRLALFGHSLGTLGIRQLVCSSALRHRSSLSNNEIHRIVLYGTPLNGSHLAALASAFRLTDVFTRTPKVNLPNLFRGYEIAHALEPDSSQLLMLKLWTESAHVDKRLPPVSIVYGLDDKVVGATSPELVNWAGDEEPSFVNQDHLGLNKLRTPDRMAEFGVLRFVSSSAKAVIAAHLTEERQRLKGILHGPWLKASRLARKFVEPQTDFSHFISGSGLIDLLNINLDEQDVKREDVIRWVFAPHWKKLGQNRFHIQNSIAIRESFDEALTLIELLEIAVDCGYVSLSRVRDEARAQLVTLLWSEGARLFVRDYDYVLVLLLAKKVEVKITDREYRLPKPNPNAAIRFATFLSQLPLWYEDQLLEQWQGFLDDYVDFKNEQQRFWNFLKTGKEGPRASEKFKELIIGADRLVAYLSNLFEIMEPDERGAIGQLFAYYIARFFGYSLTSRGYRVDRQNGVDWSTAIGRSPFVGGFLDADLSTVVRDLYQQRIAVISAAWHDIREYIRVSLA